MTGNYLPDKFSLSSNPFRKRNWRLGLSYLSFGALAPFLMTTFYEHDEETILRHVTKEGMGYFWKDIINIKIMSREEEHRQANSLINDLNDGSTKPESLTGSYLSNYFKKVMIFNSTPKVNLVG